MASLTGSSTNPWASFAPVLPSVFSQPATSGQVVGGSGVTTPGSTGTNTTNTTTNTITTTAAAVDPSAGIDPQVWAQLQQLNWPGKDAKQPPPQWAITFAQDELDAQYAGDVFGATLQGFKFPATLSVAEFSAIESLAHQFAANSNWKYMPTASMIMQAYNAGITDKSQAFAMWFGQLSATDKAAVPWLQYGQTQLQYLGNIDSTGQVLDKLTGSSDTSQMPQDVLQKSISEGWSSGKLETYLRGYLGTTSPWLQEKYGYTYQSWQQNKTAHQQDIIQRYGIDKMNQDQLYLQNQIDPLATSQQARGSQVSYNSGSSQASFYNKTSAMDYGTNPVR